MKGNNPSFPTIKMTSSKLCGGNLNLPIKFTLFNYKDNGNHKYKGEFVISARELESTTHHNFQNKVKNKSAGNLVFH
jgi:hypothetical protein